MVCHETYKDSAKNWLSPEEVVTINGKKFLKKIILKRLLLALRINVKIKKEYNRPR